MAIIFITIAIICILRIVFQIEVQKNFAISCMIVIGIKVTSSVVDIVTWSYGSEIFPSNMRGMAFGIMM